MEGKEVAVKGEEEKRKKPCMRREGGKKRQPERKGRGEKYLNFCNKYLKVRSIWDLQKVI